MTCTHRCAKTNQAMTIRTEARCHCPCTAIQGSFNSTALIGATACQRPKGQALQQSCTHSCGPMRVMQHQCVRAYASSLHDGAFRKCTSHASGHARTRHPSLCQYTRPHAMYHPRLCLHNCMHACVLSTPPHPAPPRPTHLERLLLQLVELRKGLQAVQHLALDGSRARHAVRAHPGVVQDLLRGRALGRVAVLRAAGCGTRVQGPACVQRWGAVRAGRAAAAAAVAVAGMRAGGQAGKRARTVVADGRAYAPCPPTSQPPTT